MHALLSDPGGTLVRCRLAPRCCLPLLRRRRLPRLERFRGSITRPAYSLCTLRSVGCPTATQHSVPAVGTLGRAGLDTRWVLMRNFRDIHTSSQSPRLGLAHPSCVQVDPFQDSFKLGNDMSVFPQLGRTLFGVRPIARRCRRLAEGLRPAAPPKASHEVRGEVGAGGTAPCALKAYFFRQILNANWYRNNLAASIMVSFRITASSPANFLMNFENNLIMNGADYTSSSNIQSLGEEAQCPSYYVDGCPLKPRSGILSAVRQERNQVTLMDTPYRFWGFRRFCK